ncbi:hypothetical protein NKH36_15795 [Mesorhizobium sp. M1312]|uniref:hypothetical protein n=1 Tax=unclassified Mesorhizobium TaxID=325217 RepID=UPI00333CA625
MVIEITLPVRIVEIAGFVGEYPAPADLKNIEVRCQFSRGAAKYGRPDDIFVVEPLQHLGLCVESIQADRGESPLQPSVP